VSLDTYALTTVAKTKKFLGIANSDLTINAFTIYNSSNDATAATVEVTTTAIILIVTAGDNAGTTTLTFSNASYDTISELVIAINALDKGWVCNLSTAIGNEDSGDLVVIEATGCLLVANTQDLELVDNYKIETLINQATDAIEKYCDRNLASRDYTLERYDGMGETELYLPNYPITDVARLVDTTIGVFTIYNNSSDASRAMARVTSTGIVLTIIGGDNEDTSTLLFADYATLTLLSNAIADLDKGWVTAVSSNYTGHVSTDLLDRASSYCLNVTISLEIPGTPEWNFEIYEDEGYLYKASGFSKGRRNIILDYTGGYITIPASLEQACQSMVKYLYDATDADSSMKSEKLGDYQYTLSDKVQLPDYIQNVLIPFKRLFVL